ncbi:MAG: hypothetical protein ACFN4O_01935 [Anaeroglobus sp.]
MYAHADLYGLGKGIFPKDKFPKLPAHPHCLCRIKPIVDGMIDMSRQKDNVDKGGKAYIDTLPKREQERLLGIHGRKDVMNGKKEWFANARSVSKEGFEVRKPAGKDNVLQEPAYRVYLSQKSLIERMRFITKSLCEENLIRQFAIYQNVAPNKCKKISFFMMKMETCAYKYTLGIMDIRKNITWRRMISLIIGISMNIKS